VGTRACNSSGFASRCDEAIPVTSNSWGDEEVAALEMALTHRRPPKGLIVHSDRGVPYACTDPRQFLAAQGLVASMSRAGNPYDNAWMESAISKIKSEVPGQTLPPDWERTQQQLFVGLECWYNQRRRHRALNYQSPVACETQFMKN
jgi:transposase InsO family protein